jgi:hypothetical protein
MTALHAARNDIHDACRDEIRRLSVAHITYTADVALANWEHLFFSGRFSAARGWWALYEQLRTK